VPSAKSFAGVGNFVGGTRSFRCLRRSPAPVQGPSLKAFEGSGSFVGVRRGLQGSRGALVRHTQGGGDGDEKKR